ncbi:MAG: LytTR family DNA-binding domain-containing protein [Oscillospiraceae bacterium]|nr:LytTR family DNA-binding domain-containing protein [Oscillospiraceae bacterium]
MHIAICDDEYKELLHLQSLAQKYNPDMVISLFDSAESLLAGIKTQPADVILLDIEMGALNGFDAAKKLRGMPSPPLIIFVTNSSAYTYRGYEVAFRYLPKPVVHETLENALNAAVDKIAPQKFSIAENGRSYVLPISDILYFEASGHTLTLHSKTRTYECRMKIGDAEALLPRNAFVSPHKGYIVNLDFIDAVNEHDLVLTNAEKIPISRRRKKAFELALFRFVRRSW